MIGGPCEGYIRPAGFTSSTASLPTPCRPLYLRPAGLLTSAGPCYLRPAGLFTYALPALVTYALPAWLSLPALLARSSPWLLHLPCPGGYRAVVLRLVGEGRQTPASHLTKHTSPHLASTSSGTVSLGRLHGWAPRCLSHYQPPGVLTTAVSSLHSTRASLPGQLLHSTVVVTWCICICCLFFVSIHSLLFCAVFLPKAR